MIFVQRYVDKVKDGLSVSQRRKIRYFLNRLLYAGSVPKLAAACGGDKAVGHNYATCYQTHFYSLRNRKLNVLEIGIGGYGDPKSGGQSLRMWKAFFPNSRIYGIDIVDKSFHDEYRIKTYKGSQFDKGFLQRVAKEIGPIDIVIDDGSHYNDHVIESFSILFPFMVGGGIYAVEDLQTSYWPQAFGHIWGGSTDLSAPNTSMNFFKRLVDGLNYEEFLADNYAPSYFDRHVTSVHFYHNILFVYKGDNSQGSNMLGKRF